MKRLILVGASLALVSACSEASDRRAPVDDDNLTRPLEVARVDTTQPLAPVEREVTRSSEEVTRSPQPVTMPKPRRARPQPKKAASPVVASAEVTTPEVDTTVRGYAPDATVSSAQDTAPDADSVPPPGDTATAVVADTGAIVAPDTAAPAARDTAARAAPDTAAPTTAETVAARTDTASIPVSDPSPSAAVTQAARTLPIGTEIHAALDDSINSRTDTAGRVVTAVVMENVTGSDGKTLIAAGAPVRFTVTRLSAAKSKSAQGRLALQVDGIGIGGELRRVSADVQPVPHELRGRGVGTSEAAKVGVGAAGGAVLGRVIGGDTRGAVIGGVVGAAGGAVVASQTASRDVVVKARTPVVFVLTEPLVAQ